MVVYLENGDLSFNRGVSLRSFFRDDRLEGGGGSKWPDHGRGRSSNVQAKRER